MDTIEVTLIANAGVMVEFQNKKFLLDALHDDCDQDFSPVPEEILKDMYKGLGKFSNTDYLLFSHCHSDHYVQEMTRIYLLNNRIKKIFLPFDEGDKLSEFAKAKGISCTLLDLPVHKAFVYRVSLDIAITAFNCMHVGEVFSHISNYCYLLTLGGQNILFTADADLVPEYFESIVKGIPIHAVFVNPIFYNTPRGRKIIDEVIKPAHVVVYHLPFEKDGGLKMIQLVEKNITRHPKKYTVTAMYQEAETLHFA